MRTNVACTVAFLSLACAAPSSAQVAAPRPAGRVSFYVNSAKLTGDGVSTSASEVVTSVIYGLNERPTSGLEYGVDFRHARRSEPGRPARLSLYDAYVGARLGSVRVRGGQMWLTDLGALGSVAGGMVEYRLASTSSLGRLRVGGFGGMEPTTYDAGYVEGVRKYGGYAVLEGGGGRRHVAGYVRIDHGALTERSVVAITNFVPVQSRVFIYQMAEVDLTGPGGQGSGGLSYFFLNARVSAGSRVELQGLFNRGRSVDARTITDDLLNGRTVSTVALDGLLYESAGGRVTVEVARQVRVHAGYTRDRNNRDSASTGRLSLGVSAQNIASTGLDLTVSDSRVERPTGQYHSLYVSAGRQLGRAVYVTGDYSSAVNVVRFTRLDGFTVETRPSTQQFGGSAMIYMARNLSLLITATQTTDEELRELRLLTGLTYRLR